MILLTVSRYIMDIELKPLNIIVCQWDKCGIVTNVVVSDTMDSRVIVFVLSSCRSITNVAISNTSDPNCDWLDICFGQNRLEIRLLLSLLLSENTVTLGHIMIAGKPRLTGKTTSFTKLCMCPRTGVVLTLVNQHSLARILRDSLLPLGRLNYCRKVGFHLTVFFW